ncbi:hypothetical protein F5Y06DRAFT_307099 [Hypoxylon sp. FL0890]|nr:hypothetical protein F5Y06DRAFT_307099 [Hypoxylon sp. FL0890]
MSVQSELSSMEEMWRDAAIRFNERTGMNVDIKPPKTLDDCIKELEGSRFPEESEEKSSREKLEDYGVNILRCLKLLGGVAAQGAEMVFGAPSSICFNALFLLLDIPEQLRSFREAIEGLFETLAPCLSVFRIYEKMDQFNEIEPELKQAIHQVMICFVDICALSIQLRDSGKWRKFKSRMKQLLIHDDSGIKAELEKFERLTKSHYSIQSTQTLKVVLDTRGDLTEYFDRQSEKSQQMANDVASLKAADDKRNSEDSKRKYIENIKKRMGIDDSLYRSSRERCDKPRKDCVPNTAVWFMEHPEFRRWAERDDKEADGLFILTGAPNTGKSVILSAMVYYLRSIYESPARHSPRTLIAAHFFPNTTTKDDQDKRPIVTALKCIALQLANQDSAYAKSLSQACDSKSENTTFFRDASCQELWAFLRLGSPRGNATHYLILDGLAGLPEESSDNREQKKQLLDIICSSAQSSVRVLLSVRRDSFRNEELASHFNLEIEQYIEPDIQKYIDHYLRFSDIFQDPEDEPLRTKVLHTLAKQVHGNFNKAKAALENIREVVASDGLESEIDRVLNESNMNEKQITRTVITQLEEKLAGDEIDELNELLIWVICGKIFFDINELNAALVLRSKRRGTLRLRKKLEGKYSNILTIRRDGTVVVTDDMDDVLTKRRVKPRSVDDTPTFTATITITKGDLRSVQSFLWSLSQKVDSLAHNAFGFEQIAEQKGMKNNIQVNEVDANLTIVRRTFSMLAGEPNKESEALGHYLLDFLPQHLNDLLEKATGYDELTASQKQEIGEGLFSLFVTGEVVERHWQSCQSLIWYREPGEVETFRRWLEDPIAISHLGRLDREWLKKVKAHSNPNQALLENIMRTVARHWLCDRKWNAAKALNWLRGFRQMPSPHEKAQDDIQDDGSDASSSRGSYTFNTVSVEDVAEWCREVLTITSDEDKALMNERLGETYFEECDYLDAIEAYSNAVSLHNPGWKCIEGLSRALAANGQYAKACQEMEKALLLLSSEDDPQNDSLLSTNYRRLAEWQIELKQPRSAIEYAKRATELAPEDHKPQFELLRIYLDNDLTDDAANLLGDLVKAGNQQDGTNLLGQIITNMLNVAKSQRMFGRCFKVVSRNAETFIGLLQQMDLVIDQARRADRISISTLTRLLLYKGIALYRYGLEQDERIQRALQCWEQCLGVDSHPGAWNYAQVQASTWVCGYYFDQAKALRGSGSHDIDTYLKKMNDIVNKGLPLFNLGPKTYLASYYARFTKDISKAREILHAYIDAAFGLLSDDIADNDGDGYYQLAEALLYCGDETDALAAFSLPLPSFTISFTGDIISWMLEYETELEEQLGEELIVTIKKANSGSSLEDQMELALNHIDTILQGIGDNQSTDQEVNMATRQDIGNMDSHGIHETPTAQTTVVSSFADGDTVDGSNKKLESPTNKGPRGAETKSTYEKIRSKIKQWLNAYKFGARRWCDVCDTMWDLDHAMNHCKYCYDIDFCDACLNKLKTKKLDMPSLETYCNESHDWLRLPPWDKETYFRALRKEVYIGGRIDDEGKRVEGKTVTVAEWLEGLKAEWATKE